MINYVFLHSKMGIEINSTFFTLVPNEFKPSSFSKFQPISLCNVSYKFMSKIIASSLKMLFPKLI